MTQSMQYTMPLMFGFFSLQFPSGLSIYFILANIIGIVQGLYMRRVTDREKAERAASGETRPYVIEAEKTGDKTAKSRPSANGSGASKSKSTSGQTSAPKRKKRSAKR